jgi:hypothetical protein
MNTLRMWSYDRSTGTQRSCARSYEVVDILEAWDDAKSYFNFRHHWWAPNIQDYKMSPQQLYNLIFSLFGYAVELVGVCTTQTF